jgi:hypothetical protein
MGRGNCVGQSLANAELYATIPCLIFERNEFIIDKKKDEYHYPVRRYDQIIAFRKYVKYPISNFTTIVIIIIIIIIIRFVQLARLDRLLDS